MELPMWYRGKESSCQCRRYKRHVFDFWVGKIPWRRKGQLAPVLLPRKSHGQRSLAGHSPWGYIRVSYDWATELNWLKDRFEFLKWQESISSSHFLSSWTANLKPMILFHFYQNQSPSFSASWHILILFVNPLKQRAVKTWLIFLYSQLSYTESSDSPRETASHKLKVKLFPFSHQPLTLPVQYINIIFKMHVCSF